MADESHRGSQVPRRRFVTGLFAGLAGLVAVAAAVAPGLAVLFDPLRKRKVTQGGSWTRVASLAQIPADGKPRQFKVVEQEPRDKWNLYEPQPVGAVFLMRTSSDADPVALSSICPHLGCGVDYDAKKNLIVCPCHNGQFGVDGKQTQDSTVSPRDLDPLEVRVDEQSGDVLVNYKRFKGGIAEREEV